MAKGKAAVVPILLPTDLGNELSFVYRDNPQNKGNKKLVKSTGDKNTDREEAFFDVIDIDGVPTENTFINSEFHDVFTYDKPTQTERGFGRVETDVHVYLVVCPKSAVELPEESDLAVGTDPTALSFENEVRAVTDAKKPVNNDIRNVVIYSITRASSGEFTILPAKRSWVTPADIRKGEKPLKYGWELEFGSEDGTPWVETEDTFTEAISEQKAEMAIERSNKGGFRGGSHIYCCNPDCKRGHEYEYEREVLDNLLGESPHPPSQEQHKKLEEADSAHDRVPIPHQNVSDGSNLYLLLEPEESTSTSGGTQTADEDDTVTVAGWYCCPDCVDAVTWPSPECVTVAVEVYVDHPPDVRRTSGRVTVDEIKGVYRTKPKQAQSDLANY